MGLEVDMYTRILLPLDGSPPSEHAAGVGLALAARLKAEVVLLQVLEPHRFQELRDHTEALAQARTVGQALLEHWHKEARRRHIPTVQRLEEQRDIAQAILQTALEQRCDLVILGTHGRTGLPRVLLGSVAERVARLSPLPVLLVRGEGPEKAPEFKRILVALDGSEFSQEALRHADALAGKIGARLSLVHVVPDITQMLAGSGRAWMYANRGALQAQLEAEQKRLREQGQFILKEAQQQCTHCDKLHPILQEAHRYHISERICRVAEAERADLIVLGTHGLSGWRQFFLGSVANEVAHRAKQPVLLVRKPQNEPDEAHLPAPGK
ncbi:universal stress protein [Meiothermus granaticius NBRC 107808]|uniref:Universal stress protein n=2 Tax=Meiothermus TaxID=65551 RepID=A0A399F4B8_9DEIN|nr:Universal stress protein [Meiothermus granaticius NBRC 107808]GEM85428.1 universal stress protein [Meiothermus granaticius NBRC 107808]